MNPKRLYRSRRDRKLAGVAGGMADYLDLDPTVVRVLWILSVFLGGFTILLYVILAFVMPEERAVPWQPPTTADGDAGASPDAPGSWAPAAGDTPAAAWGPVPGPQPTGRGDGRATLGFGILLVAFGVIALVGPAFPAWASAALGPAFILALGIALVAISVRRPSSQA